MISIYRFAQQWWDAKREHYDCVIFFRKGYFYELFNQDADIGRQVLGLKVTARGEMKLAGVPMTQLEPWAAQLINRGYKVAVVEEMETSIGMGKRKALGGGGGGRGGGSGKKNSVIRREIKQVYTAGTLLDEGLIGDSSSAFLLSLCEDAETFSIGFCAVDVSVGSMFVGQVSGKEEEGRSELETLLLRLRPKEVLYAEGHVGSKALRMLRNTLPESQISTLPRDEQWTSMETEENICRAMSENEDDDERLSDVMVDDDGREVPDVKIPETLNDNNMSSETVYSLDSFLKLKGDSPMLWLALGFCCAYLKKLRVGSLPAMLASVRPYIVRSSFFLDLDAQTLRNLSVLESEEGVAGAGTLLGLLDRTKTPMGQRMMRQWLCYPLHDVASINNRLDCIETLISNDHLRIALSRFLTKQSGDLERRVSRLRMGLYVAPAKLAALLIELKEIQRFVVEFRELCEQHSISLDSLLCRLSIPAIQVARGLYRDLDELLSDMEASFDWQEAKKVDSISPKAGVCSEYDECCKRLKEIEDRMDKV